MKVNFFASMIILLFVVFAVPLSVFAQASLFLSPASGSYKTGELFSVLVNMNTGGESVNAGTAQINFDNLRLEVVDVGFTRSIFTIWTEEPIFSNAAGTVTFSGGVPSPGFTGASGSILRITFKAKSVGQASVMFVSGSILANDGLGTNIGDSLRGALYNVVSAPPAPSVPKDVSQEPLSQENESTKPIEAPLVTTYPEKLHRGDILTLKGLGIPLSRINLSFQKGSDDPEYYNVFAGTDGRFTYTYESPVKAGFYRISARNILSDGTTSGPSEVVMVEVVDSAFIRIGVLVVSYAAIIFILLALLFTFAFFLLYVWTRIRRWRRHQGAEISEAEDVVHRSFDVLRQGMGNYVSYLVSGKSATDIKNREKRTRKDIVDELNLLEKNIEKEIGDIKHK